MTIQRIKFDFLVHDLKVPLAVIEAGITSLINKTEKYGPLTDKQLKVLKRALRNTIITRRLVNDALELGRSSEGIITKSRFPVSFLVEHCLIEVFDLTDHRVAEGVKDCPNLPLLRETLAPKGIYLQVDERLWCREVLMDESKMRQILRNLLNNALKYRKQRIDLTLEERNGSFCLSVGDDGDGIPTEQHQNIFECYFQLEAERNQCVRGHGLGLAGVMVLVEDMGGRLFLDSDLGKGAKFSVEIPL